jgi:ubiquinol-cytochrome c reductase cytochrome c1 subunit
MRTLIIALILTMSPGFAVAAGGEGYHLDQANIDPESHASLQRGARLFVNYCMGCHSAQHQRYNRFARDAGLTDALVQDNLIFTGAKVGDRMENAMPKADAARWFGAAPPDLTLTARSRGTDWLYTYLRTFYRDPTRPLGANNAVFPQVGMPNVLWELQGWQEPIYKTALNAEGDETQVLEGFEVVEAGSMTAPQFDRAMRDLVNFMSYMAEPGALERKSLGIKVVLFLILMIVVFYLLKKEYWKDVH